MVKKELQRVILVHGTFSSTRDYPATSRLRRALEGLSDYCTVDVFGWSGENSQEVRRKAAEELSEFIENCNQQPVILVGHSHGGLVSLCAAHQHPSCKVISLGTPFLHFGPRKFIPSWIAKVTVSSLILLLITVIIFCVWFLLSGVVVRFGDKLLQVVDTEQERWMVVILVIGFLCFTGYQLIGFMCDFVAKEVWESIAAWRNSAILWAKTNFELSSGAPNQSIDYSRFLCLHDPKDEAFWILRLQAIASSICWIATTCVLGIAWICVAVVVLAWVCCLFAPKQIADQIDNSTTTLLMQYWHYWVWLTGSGIVLLLIGLLFTLFVQGRMWGYGRAIFGLYFWCSVYPKMYPTYADGLDVTVRLRKRCHRFVHCRYYNDDEVVRLVCSFVRQWPTRTDRD